MARRKKVEIDPAIKSEGEHWQGVADELASEVKKLLRSHMQAIASFGEQSDDKTARAAIAIVIDMAEPEAVATVNIRYSKAVKESISHIFNDPRQGELPIDPEAAREP